MRKEKEKAIPTVDSALDATNRFAKTFDEIGKKQFHTPESEFMRFKANVDYACHQLMEELMDMDPFSDPTEIIYFLYLKFYHLELHSGDKIKRQIFSDCKYTLTRIMYILTYSEDHYDEYQLYLNKDSPIMNEDELFN